MLRIDSLVLLIINCIHNSKGGCVSVHSKQIDGKLIYNSIELLLYNHPRGHCKRSWVVECKNIYGQICLRSFVSSSIFYLLKGCSPQKNPVLFLFIVFLNIYSYGADTSIGKVSKQNGPTKKMKSYEDPEDIAIITVTRVLCNACDDDLFR